MNNSKTLKKIITAVITCMLTGTMSAAVWVKPVYADAENEEEHIIGSFETAPQKGEIANPGDSDELLTGYFEEILFGEEEEASAEGEMTLFSSNFNRDNLNSVEREVYDHIKEMIESVAAGESGTTIFSVDIKEALTAAGGWNERWTAADLGVDYVYDPASGVPDKAWTALADKFSAICDSGKIFTALYRDCAYELYWARSNYSYKNPAQHVSITKSDGEYVLITDNYTFDAYFYVIDKYADISTESESDIDTSTISCAREAAENARAIVADAAALSDYEKLYYYKEKLCDLNTYNYEAASASYTGGYGDPWQVIYMFDGDPDTNVVCEGYSKSFQYLCELSDFKASEIVCYSVIGDLYADYDCLGGHMWNIIHMDDGNNYIVDVTNCDGNTTTDTYFIAPYTSITAVSGYSFSPGMYNADRLGFLYYPETINLYTTEQLTICSTAYEVPEEIIEPAGHNYVDGYCTICGSPEIEFILQDDGTYDYYYRDVNDTEKYGLVDYENNKFVVANGKLAAEVQGLFQDPDDEGSWYYCAGGQVVDYTGLALYDNQWFYVENGKLNTTFSAFVEYNGSLFFVGAGMIQREAQGLCMDPSDFSVWYYLADGQVVDYTGLTLYDNHWFYVIDGRFATEFSGEVEYDGETFTIVNGELAG